MKSLEALKAAMVANHADVLDRHNQWRSDLPTFGGSAPADTLEVWSWDETSLLVGTCGDDLQIVDRAS